MLCFRCVFERGIQVPQTNCGAKKKTLKIKECHLVRLRGRETLFAKAFSWFESIRLNEVFFLVQGERLPKNSNINFHFMEDTPISIKFPLILN